MGTREKDTRLEDLRNQGIPIYSISRLNTLHQCPYQCYLNYIKKIDAPSGNVWSYLGGATHDALEATLHGANTEVVKNAIQEELDNLDLVDIDFPLDRNGNSTIRDNWITNMMMFASNYKPLTGGEFETEQLILLPVNGGKQYMQGYIDVIRHNPDGTVSIFDWKTSSQFTKDHLIEAGRQLLLYGMAMEDAGYKVSDISWVMLKYCETTWTLKNGKTKSKVSEWRNMISDMRNPIEKTLSDIGLDETDIEILIDEGIKKNSWDVFPDEIKNKFTTTMYIRQYEYSDENKKECMEYVESTINSYESRGIDDENWESCDVDKNSFFCASLCSFGGKTGLCKHYCSYLDKFNSSQDEDEDDLF